MFFIKLLHTNFLNLKLNELKLVHPHSPLSFLNEKRLNSAVFSLSCLFPTYQEIQVRDTSNGEIIQV